MEKNRIKSSDIKELQARKKALREEMVQIQQEIKSSLDEVRHSFFDRVSVRYWVEKYPLHLLGTAVMAGFLVGRKTGGKRKSGPGPKSVFTGLLMDEIKKMATQRAVRYLVRRIEEAIDKRNDHQE